MFIDDNALFGITRDHLTPCDEDAGHFLHCEVAPGFKSLTLAAREAGFELKLASSFRPFERQLAIFNGKFSGQRPILDMSGQVVDISGLDDWQICQAILLYSALPGASRHHWGTDVDFYDGATLPTDYQIQLVEQEYCDQGPFAPLACWLSAHCAEFGFFFPYRRFNGGIASEPWHISYAPIAEQYLSQLTPQRLAQQLEHTDIKGKTAILANMDEIFSRFVGNIAKFSATGPILNNA